MGNRIRVPSDAQKSVLYESAYACAICGKENIQIHHIDKDSSNNNPENLIVLCQEHHGEAHTTRDLTLSLSKQRLKHAKRLWIAQVADTRRKAATLGFQRAAASDFLKVGVTWGYINHKMVAALLDDDILKKVEPANFELCKKRSLVDENGLIFHQNVQPAGSYLSSTIYDQFSFGDDQRVHKLYCEFVDAISQSRDVVHLSQFSWTKGWFRHFVKSGDFLFVRRGHYFKLLEEQSDNQIRLAYTFNKKIRLEYLIETKNMFGTSAITVSFAGHQTCSAFVMVKSVSNNDELVVHCTPIALGVGSWPIEVGNVLPKLPDRLSGDPYDEAETLTR